MGCDEHAGRPIRDYNDGVYIVKLKNVSDFLMEGRGIYFVEILQWGRILEKNEENIDLGWLISQGV